MSHFKSVSSEVIPVNKYVSEKTGITVIIAKVEGTRVNGFICLETEAHDGDGLPHKLDQLIFLGSEHIYLDDKAGPTLTKHGFITEMHHVAGKGENAGDVYFEIEGRNSSLNRCELQLLRAMCSETGLSAERTPTDVTKVKAPHKKCFRPEDLTIILTGQIEAEDVFAALATFEDDIIAKKECLCGPLDESALPVDSVAPRPNYVEVKVQFPADTEEHGQIIFGWRGLLQTEDSAMKELTACAILLRYLCDTAAAPLQRCLVEREVPLAGDISYNLTDNLASLITIKLDNVPMDKLKLARDEALKCLRSLRTGEDKLDMDRLHALLRNSDASLESDPRHSLASSIGDAFYSQNKHHFLSLMNPETDVLSFFEESPDYWLGLLRKYFTEDLVIVMGSPSIELRNKMKHGEKKRLGKQGTELGEAGPAKKKIGNKGFNELEPLKEMKECKKAVLASLQKLLLAIKLLAKDKKPRPEDLPPPAQNVVPTPVNTSNVPYQPPIFFTHNGVNFY